MTLWCFRVCVPGKAQAYARGDMLARRMHLMESWSEYCSRPDTANGVVVPAASRSTGISAGSGRGGGLAPATPA